MGFIGWLIAVPSIAVGVLALLIIIVLPFVLCTYTIYLVLIFAKNKYRYYKKLRAIKKHVLLQQHQV